MTIHLMEPNNRMLGHPPDTLFCAGAVLLQGNLPSYGEMAESSSRAAVEQQFPGFAIPLFIVILPLGRPEQFPSPRLHAHP